MVRPQLANYGKTALSCSSKPSAAWLMAGWLSIRT